MARIGYNFKGDMEGFKNQVHHLMNLSKVSLELKRKEITIWLDGGFYPYTKRYLHSFRNHFSTIGLNGMNEAILNFTNGKEDIAHRLRLKTAVDPHCIRPIKETGALGDPQQRGRRRIFYKETGSRKSLCNTIREREDQFL